MANAKPLYRNVSLIMVDLIIEEIPLNIEINWDARHGGHTVASPTLKKLRQEDQESEPSLGYTGRSRSAWVRR